MPNFPTTLLAQSPIGVPRIVPPDPAFADDWMSAIVMSVKLMLLAAAIACAIGLPTAFGASLLPRRSWLVRVWSFVAFVTLAMPLILLAASWEATAGKFGWLVTTMTGGNLVWVAWIHGMHGAAMVGLATAWATRRISPLAIQQAQLDFSPAAAWWKVRLPLALPWTIGAIIGVMILAATEMSVVNLHSVRTVADQFYLFYAVDPSTTSVLVTTLVPLVVGGVPLLLWRWLFRRRWHVASDDGFSSSTETGVASRSWVRWPARLVVFVGTMLLCLPLAGLIVQTGHSVQVIDGQRQATFQWSAAWRSIGEAPSLFGDEIAWTIQLAALAIACVLPIAWGMARYSRSSPTIGMMIDVLATLLFLIPGPVIGMGIAIAFRANVLGSEWLATRTLFPTVIAVGLRSAIVAYAILRNGYGNIDDATWASARMDGSLWWRWRRVEWPLLRCDALIACVAIAIVSTGDVPAALPVLPPGVTTIGTRLFGLLHSGARYQEASLAIIHVALVIGLCGLARVTRLHLRRPGKGLD